MWKKTISKWKNRVILLGLLLGGLGFLSWLILGALDSDDPWLQVPDQVALVGPKTSFSLKARDQDSGLKEIKVTLNQEGQEKVVLSKTFPPGGEPGAEVEIPLTLEAKALGLKEGKATLTVTARDRSWRNAFQGRTTAVTREVEVDLLPLTVQLVAVSHLLQAGGSGCVVYRVSKPVKESGIRIDGRLFQGFPAPKGAKGEQVALFAVPQEPPTVMTAEIVARGALGSEVKQGLTLKIKTRKWRHDNMLLSEGFLRQVAAAFPEAHQGDPVQTFKKINQEYRKTNHERMRQVCAVSQPQPLWTGAFQRFVGKPMARYGDRRTYIYQNRVIDDRVVHQGEDLASLINAPVVAGNNGLVVLAEPMGIYGNTVILDHGLGLFSMYSHLSKIEVKVGDRVEKGKPLGRTGSTGLAGGDHLHYGMMLQGEFVNPLEWWDAHWLRDQVEGLWAKTALAAAPDSRPAGRPKAEKKSAAPAKKQKGRRP
jgi:murein DD-endopeptidase MepM/ murein hydrolase activator NlpD